MNEKFDREHYTIQGKSADETIMNKFVDSTIEFADYMITNGQLDSEKTCNELLRELRIFLSINNNPQALERIKHIENFMVQNQWKINKQESI